MHESPRIVLVCYHYLKREDQFGRIWGHTFDLFRAHVEHLEKTCPPIDFKDLDAYLKGEKESLPPRSSIIAFDDALREHSEIIAPYLEEKGIRAMFNVPSDVLESKPIAPQINHFMMAFYGVRKYYAILNDLVDSRDKPLQSLLTIDGHELMNIMDLHNALKRTLKYSENDIRLAALLERAWSEVMIKDVPDVFEQVYLSQRDVRDLHKAGHTIGCHGKTHALINDETFSEDLLEREFVYAKSVIEETIDDPVTVFTYPYGTENDIVKKDTYLERIEAVGFEYLMPSFKYTNDWSTRFLARYCSNSLDTPEELMEKAFAYNVVR